VGGRGEKWNDADYVRDYLIYAETGRALEEARELAGRRDPDEYYEPDAREWRKMYRDAAATVDAIEPEEQVELAKKLQHDYDRSAKCERLGSHFAGRRMMQSGLPLSHPTYESVENEEVDRYSALTDEEVGQAISELEAWEEGGKWSDAPYVRNYLIYEHIDEARRRQWAETDEPDFDEPSEEEWAELYDTAVAAVDAIPPADRKQRAIDKEKEHKQAGAAFIESLKREAAKETTSDIASFFFHNYFSPMDGLFMLFAVIAAYSVASGERSELA
jgi:hypothetical protein